MVLWYKIEQEDALIAKSVAQLCDANIHGEHQLFQLQALGNCALEPLHVINHLVNGGRCLQDLDHGFNGCLLGRVLVLEVLEGKAHREEQGLCLSSLCVELRKGAAFEHGLLQVSQLGPLLVRLWIVLSQTWQLKQHKAL